MVEKYVVTKRPGKPGKLKKVIDLISGKRKWPESRFEEGYSKGIKKAGVLPGAGSDFFREKETKLDEIKKFSLGKGERFSTKLDRDRRKDAYVKAKWDELITRIRKKKSAKLTRTYTAIKNEYIEKFENEFDRQSLLKGKRNKKGGKIKTYAKGSIVRKPRSY
jgi:hypothetical protein